MQLEVRVQTTISSIAQDPVIIETIPDLIEVWSQETTLNSHNGAKLVFGCGYLGLRVARKWLSGRGSVHVVTRSRDRVQVLNSQGFRAIHADVTEPSSLIDLPTIETVLFAVGFDKRSGNTIEEVYVDGLSQVISALPSSVERFIYVSSTGVYGQSNNEWVDETSECRPERRGGKACWAAEQLIANDDHLHSRTVVLRLAGIYGPGRVPHYQDLMANRPIPARDGHINLIHVDDAVKVVTSIFR